MKYLNWRGRLMMLAGAGMTLLATGGCSGMSDQQLSSVLQTTITTALTTLVQAVLLGGAGTQ